MKNYIRLALLMCFAMIVLSSCKNQNADQSNTSEAPFNTEENAGITDESAVDEKKLRTFLHSTAGTYGWETASEDVSLDFFEDGRLHIQGPDGEATMWEGTWSLEGNKLTMSRTDLKTMIRVDAKIEGDQLILDGIPYVRSN